MIDRTLDFIRAQVNSYLQSKLSLLPTEDALVLSNVSQLNETQPTAAVALMKKIRKMLL